MWNPDSTLWIYGHFSPLSRCIYVIGLETSRLPLLRIFATYINLLIEKSWGGVWWTASHRVKAWCVITVISLKSLSWSVTSQKGLCLSLTHRCQGDRILALRLRRHEDAGLPVIRPDENVLHGSQDQLSCIRCNLFSGFFCFPFYPSPQVSNTAHWYPGPLLWGNKRGKHSSFQFSTSFPFLF